MKKISEIHISENGDNILVAYSDSNPVFDCYTSKDFTLFRFFKVLSLKLSLVAWFLDKKEDFDKKTRLHLNRTILKFLETADCEKILFRLKDLRAIDGEFHTNISSDLYQDVKKLCEASIELEEKTGND